MAIDGMMLMLMSIEDDRLHKKDTTPYPRYSTYIWPTASAGMVYDDISCSPRL